MSNAELCDCCGKASGALIPNAADDGETRACPECVKVLVLCPRCDRVANWKQAGDLWICSAQGCGYPGVWLDQMPYEPPLLDCVECSDAVRPMHAMCAVVDGRPVTPLCPPCYESLT